jgi:dihydrofolate reductase
MRKIIESTLLSLDGVSQDPHLWATPYFDGEAEAFALDLLSKAEAMLMGRRTYEFFAAAFPHRGGDYGKRVNEIRKYVFSNTLTNAQWSNSTIVRGDAAAATARLKQEEGNDLVIYGHGLLASTLLKAGLVDELKLWVHPIFIGAPASSRSHSGAKLRLLGVKTLGTGVIVGSYQPD